MRRLPQLSVFPTSAPSPLRVSPSRVSSAATSSSVGRGSKMTRISYGYRRVTSLRSSDTWPEGCTLPEAAAQDNSAGLRGFTSPVAAQLRLRGRRPSRRRRNATPAPGAALFEDGEHVLLAQDQVLLVLELHVGAGVLPEQDPVASLHLERQPLALVGDLAVAGGDDLALLGLLLGGVRDDDPALPDLLLLHALHDEPVVQ